MTYWVSFKAKIFNLCFIILITFVHSLIVTLFMRQLVEQKRDHCELSMTTSNIVKLMDACQILWRKDKEVIDALVVVWSFLMLKVEQNYVSLWWVLEESANDTLSFHKTKIYNPWWMSMTSLIYPLIIALNMSPSVEQMRDHRE